jgi:hypothetical protein
MKHLLSVLFMLFGVWSYASSAHCDFNNDGYDDLAIGVIGESVNGHASAGAVQIIYGKAGGLSGDNQFFTRDSSGVPGDATDQEFFGNSLACGDFNADGNFDLAIGTIYSTVNGLPGAGSVTVLYGTKKGRLSATGAQYWTQDSDNVPDQAEENDFFASSLASGDFNGDGYADLAIGVDAEKPSDPNEVKFGAVEILYGSSGGLTGVGSQFFNQDTPGLDNMPATSVAFGISVAAGNFGKDSASNCYDDLAIGIPGAFDLGGAVRVLYGSSTGLTTTGTQLWSLGSPGMAGTPGPTDQLGNTVAAAHLRGAPSACGKELDDLAIDAPQKPVNDQNLAGSVYIIYSTLNGLNATDSQEWNEDTPGIADHAEYPDEFGMALASGRLASGVNYLAIGTGFEDVTTRRDAGVVHVLFTDPSTGLLTAIGSKYYTQDTPGIQDKVEPHDSFGIAVATGDFDADGNDDLAIGAPGETLNGLQSAGAVNILYSADTVHTQFFHQNKEDIKDVEEAGDGFGAPLPH